MLKKYGWAIAFGGTAAMLLLLFVNDFQKKSLQTGLPVLAYQTEGGMASAYITEFMQSMFPVLGFPRGSNVVARREDYFLLKKIKSVELLTMMEFENMEENAMPQSQEESSDLPIQEPQTLPVLPQPVTTPEPVTEVAATAFVPHSLQQIVDLKSLLEYESLVKQFYVIDSMAMIGSDLLDAKSLAEIDLRISKVTDGPQILLYHTHSQEGFVDSVPGDESTTIVGVGERLATILEEQYGYDVLHHRGEYDVKGRDNAYSKALPQVQQILEENPSIQVVIDLHRDGVADESNKLMMNLDGRPTARFMFFNGVSCGKKTGNIDYLHNPNLKENLAFSFQMKKVAEEYYPGLTRKNYINAYRYNMHVCPRTTLIELGAQNNTLEEALNACDPIAHIIDMVLSGA